MRSAAFWIPQPSLIFTISIDPSTMWLVTAPALLLRRGGHHRPPTTTVLPSSSNRPSSSPEEAIEFVPKHLKPHYTPHPPRLTACSSRRSPSYGLPRIPLQTRKGTLASHWPVRNQNPPPRRQQDKSWVLKGQVSQLVWARYRRI